jgi:hypothetical protein
MIWYCYDKQTGEFAGSGTPHIDTDTHGSTLEAPLATDDGRYTQTFSSETQQWETTWVTGAAFALRFTPEEIDAITHSANPSVQYAIQTLQQSPWVWLRAPETLNGVSALHTAGLLTDERVAAILAPAP